MISPRPFHSRLGLLLALTLLFLQGCSSAPPEPAGPDPVQLRALWDLAEQARSQGRVIRPETGSAVSYLQQLLALDPSHLQARRTLETIAEEFVNQAKRAADAGSYNQAWLALDRARRTDPEHPSIQPTERLLQIQENATRAQHQFSAAELASPSRATLKTLHTLGTRAKRENCRVRISADNDAQGRWLYRQLQAAPDPANGDRASLRVRAQVVIQRPTGVELLCF